MKKCVFFFSVFFFASSLFAYHPVKEVTRDTQSSCGLEVKVYTIPEGNLYKFSIVIPFSTCPGNYLLRSAILEVNDSDREGKKPLVVCPLTNFTGCDFSADSMEIKFHLDHNLSEHAYIILVYGEEEGVTYRFQLKTYLPPEDSSAQKN